jgi:integrase
MAFTLYRRHRPKCEAAQHHPPDSRTAEYQERQKGYKGRCRCEIHVSGTLNGKRIRQTTGTVAWDEARDYARRLEAGADASTATPPPPEPAPALRIGIADACKVFLTNRESAEIAPATLRKYKTFTKQLTAYADTRGYAMLDQFTTADADLFYAGLNLGSRAKGKRLGVLRALFRFAVNRKWIAESPVSPDIKPPIGSSKSADKMPFSDEEIERIRKACDNAPRPISQRDRTSGQVGCEYKNDQGSGVWTGEDLRDLIELMLHTGFRISDATLFDMKRLRGNDIMIRAQKNGNHVFAWVPDSVRERLLARAKVHGQRPFIVGRSDRLETVTNVWRRRLAQAFEAAGPFEQPPTPHRFRHAFARRLLQRGVPIPEVATLLGDTEQVVRTAYAAWVPERQPRLTRILQEAFDDKPKLVGIKGGRA